MTTTFSVFRPIAPPAAPRNVFFSDRVFASKIGNSTPGVPGFDERIVGSHRGDYRYCPVP